MPLVRIPAEAAGRNLRRSRASLWPDDRVPGDRLKGVAKVELRPTFEFSRQDRILTLGSCFAREIELRLMDLGFDCPLVDAATPAHEGRTKAPNGLLIKYTIQSIENELRWAAGAPAPPPEKLFLQLGDGVWFDPQLVGNAPPLPLERVMARRALVHDVMAQFPSCRVVIITLGLAEAWFDEELSLYLNVAPPAAALSRYPGRFRLDVLDYDDILQSLERIWAILQEHGPADLKMLLTVSPVPFKATFSGEDAITANAYSKAVQRAAASAFAIRHPGVDYVPSYEIVTMTDRSQAYEKDNVHVTRGVVRYITDAVLRAYAPEVGRRLTDAEPEPTADQGPEIHLDLFTLAKHHIGSREFEAAEAVARDLIARFGDSISRRDRSVSHYLLGGALMGQRRWAEAAEALERAAGFDPQEGLVLYKLGQCHEHLRDPARAAEVFARAVQLDSASASYAKALERARAKLAPAEAGG